MDKKLIIHGGRERQCQVGFFLCSLWFKVQHCPHFDFMPQSCKPLMQWQKIQALFATSPRAACPDVGPNRTALVRWLSVSSTNIVSCTQLRGQNRPVNKGVRLMCLVPKAQWNHRAQLIVHVCSTHISQTYTYWIKHTQPVPVSNFLGCLTS